MNINGVIYTDGREVTVTPLQFIIGRSEYLLKGITRIRFLTLKANKATSILLIILGMVMTLVGALQLITPELIPFNYSDFLTPNTIAFYGGIVLMIAGIIWLITIHDKFAVRITTAEGDKDAVVSKNRDYVQQIISALRDAMISYQRREDVIV